MEGIFNHIEWPWVKMTDACLQKHDAKLPRISIIVPSYNQGTFIEETLLSILNQNYPDLELILIDGGSTDNTLEIIRKYKSRISYWVSEKDKGQSHAINKGLQKATGEWVAWLNSDDCYLEDAFCYLFSLPGIQSYDFLYGNYFTGRSLSDSREINVISSENLSLSKIIRFFYGIDYIIPSQSVFVKSYLIKKAGYLNEDLHYCMDVDWYARILKEKPKVLKYDRTICFFRYNENTKTGSFKVNQSGENKMGKEAETIALKYYENLNFFEKLKFRSLYNYYLMYSKEPWKYDQPSWSYLIKLFFRHPLRCLNDRRVLGLFKKKICQRQS